MAEFNELAIAVRREFVGLMFALAAAEIGVQTYEVISSGAWKGFAPWFHLLLATIMIASSWVGWSRAKVRGAQDQVEKIWSIGFLILLADVAIVSVYYVVVKYTEKQTPSARPEIIGVCAAFAMYFLWDTLVAWRATNGYRRGFMSLIGLLMSAALLPLNGAVGTREVILCDLSLLLAILIYRVWQDRTNREEPPTLPELVKGFFSCPQCWIGSIVYLALLGISYTCILLR